MSGNWPEALIAALALALAVLPNEIPVVLALFLALGALRLARIGVLARWPAAVESLGSATVLAVDKTGTLTENRMGVQHLLTWPELEGWQAGETLEEPFHRLVEMAVLASRGDPVDAMELAIQRLAADQLGGTEHLHPDWPLEREYPLQSDLLVFSRLWRDTGGGLQLAAKGAPEAIADLCHLEAGKSAALLSAADGLAARGLRVLAVARGLDGVQVHEGQPFPTSGALPDHVHGYLFEPVGFLALADPLRADVPAAIATARGAGVRVVMITGDSPVTARSIADQAGLPPGPVLSGHELEELTPQVLAASLREVSVFARVMPQQKLQLVRALQAAGEVVAMTGDGVNDAPALKAADIGVAMGQRGTAVARESADLVLLNDTFSDLVAALELGRRVDANLHRALGYTLAIHLPIAALGLLPLLVPGQGLILLPVHIALLHLVIDPACTVVFEALPARAGLMRQPPRPPEAPLFGPETWRHSLTQGAVVMVAALVLAFWPNAEAESRRSLVFSLLLLAGGGLVWLNGDSRSRITAAGAGIGLGLWSLLSAIPGLQQLLSLAPLQPGQILTLMITTAVALLLAWLLAPNPPSIRHPHPHGPPPLPTVITEAPPWSHRHRRGPGLAERADRLQPVRRTLGAAAVPLARGLDRPARLGGSGPAASGCLVRRLCRHPGAAPAGPGQQCGDPGGADPGDRHRQVDAGRLAAGGESQPARLRPPSPRLGRNGWSGSGPFGRSAGPGRVAAGPLDGERQDPEGRSAG